MVIFLNFEIYIINFHESLIIASDVCLAIKIQSFAPFVKTFSGGEGQNGVCA